MKNRLIFLIITFLIAAGCKEHSETPTGPGPLPGPKEILVGKLFWHDLVGQQYDIFMADLYQVPKTKTTSMGMIPVRFANTTADGLCFRQGISKLNNVEIDGNIKEGAVLNSLSPLNQVMTAQSDFVLRNTENLTQPNYNDFAVDVNSRDWIAWVRASPGRRIDTQYAEICYMNLADRVQHQLTPINGQYGGWNFDPNWKDNDTIIWSHGGVFMEANINNMNNNPNVMPDWGLSQLDPVYSPDGTMLLFNSWRNNRKNSYIKYVLTGVFEKVLPEDYFVRYMDDNPTWIFCNTRITGHILTQGASGGRIYTRDLQSGEFQVITDNQHDFRYVTPVKLGRFIYLVFSNHSDSPPKLWMCTETGANLRELNQTGDEAVFKVLGLPIPESREDLEQIAHGYTSRFDR